MDPYSTNSISIGCHVHDSLCGIITGILGVG